MSNINHPAHYNLHPSNIECVDIAEQVNFNIGNAIKYIWRTDHKENDIIDLEKAKWYVNREILRRNSQNNNLITTITNWIFSLKRRNNKKLLELVEKWIEFETNDLIRIVMKNLYNAHCNEEDTFSLVTASNILDLELSRRVSTTTLNI